VVRSTWRRCGDVLLIYDEDKNISKDSFCSIDKKIKNNTQRLVELICQRIKK